MREGVYTERFTHRSGVDPVEIHLSLLDVSTVDVTVTHLDAIPSGDEVGVYNLAVDDSQVTEYPGVTTGGVGMYGPQFPIRLSLDTSDLEPGLYEVSIDPMVLRSENRVNLSGVGGYPSKNSVCRFVVTAAVPGEVSNALWLHDSLTGTAYGGFGAESIYGGSGSAATRVVSFRRPGLDLATLENVALLRHLRTTGYLFEYMDAIEFALQPPSFVDNYDLIVVSGQFEYLPHSFLANLQSHLTSSGNLLMCANEFSCFRARIDPVDGTMTTYRWDAELEDPVNGLGRAGVGMRIPETIWETELAGVSVWGAHNIGPFPRKDMTITNRGDTGWLFEGTGFLNVIPRFIGAFNAGNRGVFGSGDRFDLIDTAQSRTAPDTVVWAATPSTDARKWWESVPGQPPSQWPIDPDGHGICTWREESNGARIIGLSSNSMLQNFFHLPGYGRLVRNIFSYLAGPRPSTAVPSLGPAGLVTVAAAAAEIGRRKLAASESS
jgi:hypothetical protein